MPQYGGFLITKVQCTSGKSSFFPLLLKSTTIVEEVRDANFQLRMAGESEVRQWDTHLDSQCIQMCFHL
jgi:hypothetical protein